MRIGKLATVGAVVRAIPSGGRRAATGFLIFAGCVGAIGGGTSLASAAAQSSSSALSACVKSWPTYQHDVFHSALGDCSGIASSNVSTLHPAWFVQTAGAVTATPTVYGPNVYVGDSAGTFRAIDAGTGAVKWTFDITKNAVHDDQHSASFGLFVSSPAVSPVRGKGKDATVFFGGGGTLYALDAVTGAPLWAEDLDPAKPTSGIEIESSPVIDTSLSVPEVIVGDDDNGSSGIDETGVQGFNALTGALVWKYEPEKDAVVHSLTGQDGTGDACGDVWSSPAVDPGFVDPPGKNSSGHTVTATGRSSHDGLVVFGTGNCAAHGGPVVAKEHGDFATNAGLFGIDAVTGSRVWSFFEPSNLYDTGSLQEPAGGDDDFGASALIASGVRDRDGHALVIDGSKSGYVYALDEATGSQVWSVQATQPGQIGPDTVGALGGPIGSPALGAVQGKPAVFLTSAIPLPFTDDGVNVPGSGYEAPCKGTSLPACPDSTLASNPTRMVSLHAVDAATGAILWQGPSLPTYAAATYANGVVFAPSTVGFAADAYDANTGLPLWSFPLGAAPASGMSIVGQSVFMGAGTAFASQDGVNFPPQLMGVWSFTTAAPSS